MATLLVSVNIFDTKNKFFEVEEVNPENNTLGQTIRNTLKTKMIVEIASIMKQSNSELFTLLSNNKNGQIKKHVIRKVGSFSYLVVSGDDDKQEGYYNIKIIEEPEMVPKEIKGFVEEFVNSDKEQELFNYNKQGYKIYRKDSVIYMEHVYTGISAKVVLVHI